jgi:hypothetical protein
VVCKDCILIKDCVVYVFGWLVQEDDKAKLVEETGLQLKQINNWFINQRKRNWHNNSQTSTLKSKRKRCAPNNNNAR